MRINTYLTFDGQCEEAFRLYEAVTGGNIGVIMRYEDSPDSYQTPSGWEKKVMHTCLTIGDAVLMGSDVPPGHSAKPQGFSVSLQIDDPSEAERAFSALADGGAITMPMSETFWALKFGMLVDRFGIPWMVNSSRPDDADLTPV